MKQKGYYDSFSYNTPVKEHLNLWERFRLDNRLYFIYKYAIIIFRTRKEARQGIYVRMAWAVSSFYIFRFIEKAGGKFHISGMENIAKEEGPVVFIANHMSTLETMILPGIIAPHREVTFVVKESLVRHPLFCDVMKSRDPIVVGRSDPRKDFEVVMSGGQELLSKGISVIIFPQSTQGVLYSNRKSSILLESNWLRKPSEGCPHCIKD